MLCTHAHTHGINGNKSFMGTEIEMFSRGQAGIIGHPKTIRDKGNLNLEPHLTSYLTY